MSGPKSPNVDTGPRGARPGVSRAFLCVASAWRLTVTRLHVTIFPERRPTLSGSRAARHPRAPAILSR